MINLILSNTNRSLEYIKILVKNKFKINIIFIYSTQNNPKILKEITKLNFPSKIIKLKFNDINKINLSDLKKINNDKYNIISTYPGEIIYNRKLLKKKLIHCHPGDLPEFKGSTTIYYSLILKKNIFVTVFEMNSKIDSGLILFKKKFFAPSNIKDIEKNYDNTIRAKALNDYLKLNEKKRYKRTKKEPLPYYIAHPIIRQIILNKKTLKDCL
jgi:methionyl-tRNA formyltransferase